ncbi:MAG TPA: hypothetical protein VGQ76_03305 [Thermoanaerobaculia bacterium]|jgi:hypothetical protein|nr:hypothetical protein [Thermoanaerobaculia bacterium]
MLNLLTRYAIAGACVLFMVSLPLGKSEVATRLRRMSGALMLVAFAPYVFFDLVRALAQDLPHSVSTSTRRVGVTGRNALELIGALTLLAPIAYLILLVRKRFRTSSKDRESEWRHARSSGKQPVEHDRHGGHEPSLFEEEKEF